MNARTPCQPATDVAAFHPLARGIGVCGGRREGEGAVLDLAAASSAGPRHDVNEDAYSDLDDAAPLYVVADGVGGGAMAARASGELVARLHAKLRTATVDASTLREALLAADRDVARTLARHTDALGAATVALCIPVATDFSSWLLAWVGDCRVYRIGDGDVEATLLTRDDSYRHLGETPPDGGSPDDPARMVGNGAVTVPNVVPAALDVDAMFVMCSDGVHRFLAAPDLAALMRRDDWTLGERCARVLERARTQGSTDDATVLVVRRRAPGSPFPAIVRSEP